MHSIVRVSCAGLATRRQDIDRTHARDGERDSTIYVCARVSESPLAVCRHTTTLGSPQLFLLKVIQPATWPNCRLTSRP